MGYLTHPDFHAEYLIHGETTNQRFTALALSDQQFAADISWFYGALTSVLRTNGMAYVKTFKRTQDGLSLWMKFLSIYEDAGDKDTEIRNWTEVVGLDLNTFTGTFVAFINQQEQAYQELADLGKEYDYEERMESILRRMSVKQEDYGWMISKIADDPKMTYPKAITWLRQQGIKLDSAKIAQPRNWIHPLS
jgi:hypothetical protein